MKEGMLFIGEELYDLTEEPQDIIGSMVTNGVIVIDSLTGHLYDTNGKFSDKSFLELKNEGAEFGNRIEVHVDNVSATYSSNVILAEFLIENNGTVYRTWDDVTQYSDEEDIKSLEDYVPCAVSGSRTAYACIYVDGNPMSLRAYEESLKVLMKAQKENQLKDAGQMLDSAEITSYDIVVYEKAEDRMWCKVYHYYFDDAWDPRKYWNEED